MEKHCVFACFLKIGLFDISITFSSNLKEREAEMRPFSDLNLGMDFHRYLIDFGVVLGSKIDPKLHSKKYSKCHRK